jgi:hypothetical protein
MPRGYEMGRGYHGCHHDHDYLWPCYQVGYLDPDEPPEEATYIGPCRCGSGSHAYYRTVDGRIVHAAPLQVTRQRSTREFGSEPTYYELQEELAILKNRVQELEKKLREPSEPRK